MNTNLIISGIIEEINTYSEKYKCNMRNAFKNVIIESSIYEGHAKLVASLLDINLPQCFYERNTIKIDLS